MSRVLIIDDLADVRHMLREVLERAGYAVTEASNGIDAVRLFQEEQADLIITDILMPDGDGLDAIIEFRDQIPGIKIIAISGGGLVGPGSHLEAAEKFGAARTLAKPIEIPELLRAVRQVLDGP